MQSRHSHDCILLYLNVIVPIAPQSNIGVVVFVVLARQHLQTDCVISLSVKTGFLYFDKQNPEHSSLGS